MKRVRLKHLRWEASVHRGPGAERAFEAVAGHLRHYTLYDKGIVGADVPATGMEAGLVVIQKLRVGPLRMDGPVQVTRTWDERTRDGAPRAGFAYSALPGHVEAGDATFEVTLSGDDVRLRIESDSAPAKWLVVLGAPFARRLQRKAVEGAFARMRAAAAQAAGTGPPR